MKKSINLVRVAAIAAGLVCFALSPLLQRWMHPESAGREGGAAGAE